MGHLTVFALWFYFSIFSAAFASCSASAQTEETITVSECFAYKYPGDFSDSHIVMEKLLRDQMSMEEVKIRISAIPPTDIFKLDFSNAHITRSLFSAIAGYLQEHSTTFTQMRFLNFSRNAHIPFIEDSDIEILTAILSEFRDRSVWIDVSSTNIRNLDRLRELNSSYPYLIWLSEEWFQWSGDTRETADLTLREEFSERVADLEPEVIERHKTYFQVKKLGGEYWRGSPLGERFTRDTRVVSGSPDDLAELVRSDLMIRPELFRDQLEGLRSEEPGVVYRVAEEYLDGKRLKRNPIKAFLLLKHLVASKTEEELDSVIANAQWRLSTFYRDGIVVSYDPAKSKDLVTPKVIRLSPRAKEELEDTAPQDIPDDVTESYLSMGSYDLSVVTREMLERDFSVFVPREEDIMADVYENQISSNLLHHVAKAKDSVSYSAFVVGRYYMSGRKLRRNPSKAYLWLRWTVENTPERGQAYIRDAHQKISRIRDLVRR